MAKPAPRIPGEGRGLRPMVAFDLDDLIYPFMQGVVPFANNKLGRELTLEDFHTFDFEDVWGGTRDESVAMMEELFKERETSPPDPLDGAIDAISKLSGEFDMAIVTSRTDEMTDTTLDWIEMHFPATFLEVHLTNSYVTDDRASKRRKVDVCQELNAIALVDDNPYNVADVAAAGLKGILFGSFPWNRDFQLPANAIRVHSWPEITNELMNLL